MGVSTEDDVWRTLDQLKEAGLILDYTCSPARPVTVDTECVAKRLADHWHDDRHGATVILIRDDLAIEISGRVGFRYSIQQLIDSIGEPDWVYHSPVLFYHDPCKGLVYDLIYLEKGAQFSVNQPCEPPYESIYPSMEITNFSYLPPVSELSEYLIYNKNQYGGDGSKNNEDYYVQWHGFGSGYGFQTRTIPPAATP